MFTVTKLTIVITEINQDIKQCFSSRADLTVTYILHNVNK